MHLHVEACWLKLDLSWRWKLFMRMLDHQSPWEHVHAYAFLLDRSSHFKLNELFIVQQKKNLGLEDDSSCSMPIGGLVLILWEVFDWRYFPFQAECFWSQNMHSFVHILIEHYNMINLQTINTNIVFLNKKQLLSQRKLTKLGRITLMNHHQPDISILGMLQFHMKLRTCDAVCLEHHFYSNKSNKTFGEIWNPVNFKNVHIKVDTQA